MMFLRKCKHGSRKLTGRLRPLAWPPKREFECSNCGLKWWEGWFPVEYLELLNLQRSLPMLLNPNVHKGIGENEHPPTQSA